MNIHSASGYYANHALIIDEYLTKFRALQIGVGKFLDRRERYCIWGLRRRIAQASHEQIYGNHAYLEILSPRQLLAQSRHIRFPELDPISQREMNRDPLGELIQDYINKPIAAFTSA